MKTQVKPLNIFFICFLTLIGTFILLSVNQYSLLDKMSLTFLITLIALIGIIDFKTKIIPNELLIIGLCFRILLYGYSAFFTTINMRALIVDNVLAATACALVFFIGHIIKKGAGMGDVKMFFIIGLYLGLMNTFSALFYTVFIMFIYSIFCLVTKKMNIRDELPMAPFAFIGLLTMIII